MAVYHRTQRLQIFGEKPEIQKLYGSRYRMVVRCVAKNDTKAWYDDNKSQIFADFGSLYSAQMSVDGIDARAGEAYDDMVLVKNEATYTRSGEYVIIFTYETLTVSFVQEAEDKVDFDLNGLKRLTRTIIARDTVAYSSTVGTTTIVGSSPLLTLAQVSEDQLEASEDGFKRIQEVWLESGTLSETLDNVGSQKAKVIETIGADPATPSGYSLASKQESNFEGFQTNRFTFLKDNVVLSESEDKVGSQAAIVKEVFNGTPTTPDGYSIANEQVSDVDGIPTTRYTFLKDDVKLSESKDEVGSQLAISQQWFNPDADKTVANYSLASKNTSDFEGIKTVEFRFLKDNVELSRSEDKVGSQLAITTQVFNSTVDPTEANYSLAREEVSDVEGIPTKRFTFLKEDVKLSASEDEVGSQNAITEQWFKPVASRDTKSGYSLARKEESDVEGIPTERYTFLKDDVVLSESEDKVGSQLAITKEVFNGTRSAPSGYTLANEQESNVDGIPTTRYTFLKPSILSLKQELSGGSKQVSVQAFGLDVAAVIAALSEVTTDHVLLSKSESDYAGIKTTTFEFRLDESFTEDYELNGLKRISLVELSATNFSAQEIGGLAGVATTPPATDPPNVVPSGSPVIGLYLGTQKIDNGGSIKTRESVWLESGTLSETLDNVGSQKAKVIETIGTDPVTPTGYSLASKQESDFEGFQTNRFTFLKDNVVLSESEDKVGSQEAIVQEVFNGTPDTPSGYSIASKQESDVDGIPTKRFTFLKDNVILSESEDRVGSQRAIVQEVFNGTPVTPSGYSIASEQESDVDGIPTKRYTFLKDNVILSESEDEVGSQNAIVQEVFNGTPATPSGYVVANEQVSDVDGIPTRRYTFLKEDVKLSASEDEVGSQNAIAEQWFKPAVNRGTKAGYSLARKEESDVNGIPTERYTFLKPSILSLQQDFNNGLKRVSVQTFGMTDTSVSAELSEITTDHKLISQDEGDYEGIRTSTFQYQIDEAFTEDYELNGIKRISLIELSASDFSAQTVGGVSTTAPTTGLYLGTQNIDNGGTIKVRKSVWLEAGELSRDVRSVGRGVRQTTHQFLVTEGTTVGDVISRDVDDFEGLKRITVSVIARSDGTELTGTGGAEKLNYSYQDLVPFTFPGVVDLKNHLGHIFPAVRSPVESKVKADIYTYYQTSSDIVASDFTKESSIGLWNPSEWCQKISTITSSLDNPAYFNAQGLRGCRTRDAFKLTGNLYGAISNNLKYSSLGSVIQINSLELEETTNVLNGKSVYSEVFRYTSDATRRLDLDVGGSGVNIIQTRSLIARGTYTITMSWNGSQWVLTGTNSINDPQPTETGTGDDQYVFSQAANGYYDTYTNRSGSNTYTLFTSTNGASAPEDADWPSGVTAEASDNSEQYGVTSSPSEQLGSYSVAANFGFIEGRVVEGGAYGNIRISGGPPNPSGKKYTLDVEVAKAFTKLDGTDVYRKTIVIATCTAV